MRNIAFDLKDSHLRPVFQKYGSLLDITIPLNNTNNLNRGFAFLEYANKAEALKAVSALNGTKFKGRTIAVELSLPKGKYETKVQHIVENSKLQREDVIVPKQLRVEREERKKAEEEKKAA